MKNMRLSTSLFEFSKALLQSIGEAEPFLIWKSFEDHRVLCKSHLEKVDLKDDCTILEFKLDDPLTEENEYFYFYNEKLLILFKAKVLSLKSTHLKVELLDKCYLPEKRNHKRIEFNNLVLKIEITTVEEGLKQKARNHVVTISDISETGASFIVPHSQSILFQKGKQVILNKIEKIKLPKSILGKVVHTTKITSPSLETGNSQYMIGVSFDTPSTLLKEVIGAVLN